jgi:hypothetical protein
MHIAEAHFEFQLRLNKNHTNGNANFFDYEIDAYLERGQTQVLYKYYKPNLQSGMGFEMNHVSIAALVNITVKSPELQGVLIPAELSTPGRYSINLGNLTYDLIFPTKIELWIKKNNCTKKAQDIRLFQQDDRKNYINQPSFTYGVVHIGYGKSSDTSGVNEKFTALYMDSTDVKGDKQFDITKAYISYVRKPKRPWLGTYDFTTDLLTLTPSNKVYEEGVDSPVSLELEEFFHDEIVDTAVQMAAQDWNRMTVRQQQS